MRETGSGIADELRSILVEEDKRLKAISDDAAARPPAPGKWSPKEVIGHLIDSAINNQGRFVRAQLADDMIFQGYEQDEWVRVQRYRDRPWTELVTLWRDLNSSLAAVIGAMSPEILSRQRERHNLDEIAWRTVPRTEPVTLEYFVHDYIAHMKHHLSQIP